MSALNNLVNEKLLQLYQIEVCEEADFYSIYRDHLFEHYPVELNFWIGSKNEQEKNRDSDIQKVDLIFVKENDKPIAAFWGIAKPDGDYFIELVVVNEQFRRQGLYTALMKKIIHNVSQHKGLEKISICHSPNNNPVIIANLKLGFNITSMSLDPASGPLLTLTYYLNQDLYDAYTFRCNGITVTKSLLSKCLQVDRYKQHLDRAWPE